MTEQEKAEEAVHIRNLMNDASGRWLLRQLAAEWEACALLKPSGSSWDMFYAGQRKALEQYRRYIINHCGHAGIDTLLKG